jgi:hypothetical protein
MNKDRIQEPGKKKLTQRRKGAKKKLNHKGTKSQREEKNICHE